MTRDWPVQRCVEFGGRNACVSLESDFWDCLEQIAANCSTTLGCLVAYAAGDSDNKDLSGLLRVFVLTYYQDGAGPLPPGGQEFATGWGADACSIPGRRGYH